MYIKMNIFSFLLSFICLALLIYVITFHESMIFLKNLLGFHPLYAIFSLSFISLLIGLIGFVGTPSFKSKFRSVFTLILSLFLCIFVSVVLLFANLFF